MDKTLDDELANLSIAQSPVKHNLPVAPRTPDIAVVFAPNCHEHAFQRAWVTKTFLKTVVERPERLNACAVGIGAAGTLCDMDLVISEARSSLKSSKHVINVHGEEWVDKLYQLCEETAEKHEKGQIEVPEDWPYNDIYLAKESINAFETVVGAIETAVDLVFSPGKPKRVFICVRPPGHHCRADVASGFCMINNAHIAIQYARLHHKITQALIFDFDLHHGDGSQDLCWKFWKDPKNDVPISYYSLHDIHSFPTEKGYAEPETLMAASTCLSGHGIEVWNVHLEPWVNIEQFNKLYEKKYASIFRKAYHSLTKVQIQAAQQEQPFVPLIVISAGFDASEFETETMQRHKVSVPTMFYNRFTRDCVALANCFGARLVSLLEGGYSTQALATGVFSHLTGLAKLEWDSSWVDKDIAKKLEQGTKPKWKETKEWPSKGIKEGRSLLRFPPPLASQAPAQDARKTRSGRLRFE